MLPRGQLWSALEDICRNFRDFSGLEKKAVLEILVEVLANILAEQQADLDLLNSPSTGTRPNWHVEIGPYVDALACEERLIVRMVDFRPIGR